MTSAQIQNEPNITGISELTSRELRNIIVHGQPGNQKVRDAILELVSRDKRLNEELELRWGVIPVPNRQGLSTTREETSLIERAIIDSVYRLYSAVRRNLNRITSADPLFLLILSSVFLFLLILILSSIKVDNIVSIFGDSNIVIGIIIGIVISIIGIGIGIIGNSTTPGERNKVIQRLWSAGIAGGVLGVVSYVLLRLNG